VKSVKKLVYVHAKLPLFIFEDDAKHNFLSRHNYRGLKRISFRTHIVSNLSILTKSYADQCRIVEKTCVTNFERINR
jgi:hypothetical protein